MSPYMTPPPGSDGPGGGRENRHSQYTRPAPSAQPDPILASWIHEAGHTIAAHVLGLKYVDVVVTCWDDEDDDGRVISRGEMRLKMRDEQGRHASPWRHPRRLSPQAFCRAEKLLVVVIAGPIAESLLTGQDKLAAQFSSHGLGYSGALSDAQIIYSMVGRMLWAADLSWDVAHQWIEQYRHRAEALVRSHWPQIVEVADHLLHATILRPRDVEWTLRGASSRYDITPPPSPTWEPLPAGLVIDYSALAFRSGYRLFGVAPTREVADD